MMNFDSYSLSKPWILILWNLIFFFSLLNFYYLLFYFENEVSLYLIYLIIFINKKFKNNKSPI